MPILEVNISQTVKAKLKSYRVFILDILANISQVSKLSNDVHIFISLSFIGKTQMQRLNKAYRGKDQVTDVLTFGDLSQAKTTKIISTDIYICYDIVKTMSQNYGHSIDKEIKVLLVHALLHFAGYDHHTAKEQKNMQAMEQKLLKSIGLIQRQN